MQVLNLTKQIPKGRVSTYGEIAKAIGDVRASRAVGSALNSNPKLVEIPCHRVVMSDGSIGGYKLGAGKKIELLEKEGVKVEGNKILNFKNILFNDFKAEPGVDLRKLKKIHDEIRNRIVLEDSFSGIESVAGFDVSYGREDECFGACVVFDYETKKVTEVATIKTRTEFPYISTYLSFREFPVIEKLFSMLENRPTVLMIDGNGVLHPGGAGITSHASVLLDVPAIGVAKTLLCGEVTGDKVTYEGRRIGKVLKSGKAKNPVYVSPGHKISFETACRVVKEFCVHRVPEPVRRAHMLSVELRGH